MPMAKTETTMYCGLPYVRYPESTSRSARMYFRNGNTYLHRFVWERAHGPIPKGKVIHHIDGNPGNNEVSNLECVSLREHIVDRHGLESIRKAIALAPLWHRSEEGRTVHSDASRRGWSRKAEVDRTCQHCGGHFKSTGQRAKFCSNNCKSAHRRASGKDKVPVVCSVCGKIRWKNRFDLPESTLCLQCAIVKRDAKRRLRAVS